MSVKDKVAVITGSNSGIGLGVAEELARLGARVVLNSFSDSEEDHALAEKLAAEHGTEVIYISADMSDGEACRGLISKANDHFGSVDILINNAGIQHVAGIDEFPTEKWDAIIAINMSSSFHTTAAALPLMRNQGWAVL